MATYTGQILLNEILLVLDDFSIPDVNVADYTAEARYAGDTLLGTYVDVDPVDLDPATVDGYLLRDFADLWYNHFHILPNRINAGNLTSQQVRPLEMFNGHFVAKELSAIVNNDLSGVSLDITLPLNFAPLQSLNRNVVIDTVGTPVFDGNFELTIDDAIGTYYIYVTGKRVLVMPFQHNWTDRIIERLAWYNGVSKSLNGVQQAVMFRKYPRRSLDYQFLLASRSDNAARLRGLFAALMHGWQSRVFLVPIWSDATRLQSDVASGQPMVDIATTYFDYDPGAYIMLWQDEENYEVVEIAAVTSGQVEGGVNFTRDWSAKRTVVMPARLGYISQGLQLAGHTVDINTVPVSFELLPQYISLNRLVAASLASYRSLPVLMTKNNYDPTVTLEIDSRAARNDNQTGIFSLERIQPTPDSASEFAFMFNGHAQIANYYHWLHSRKGRYGAFWQPTWSHDMNVTQPIGASDTTMLIDSINYTSLYYVGAAPAYNRRDVMIRLKNGTYFFRRVTGVSLDPDDPIETVSFDTSLGQIVNPADIDRVSFLLPSTLKGDAVEIVWESGNVAQSHVMIADAYDSSI